MFHPIVSHKYKFICFWNAKCACGTIKKWFLNIHGIYDWEYSPHSEISKYTPVINSHNLLETPYKDYYKFVVVRNPWKRLVSYYKNKKILMRHKNITFPIDRNYHNETGDITFNELVKLIANSSKYSREDHVADQYIGLETVKFNKIVKLENIDNDMKEVEKILEIPSIFNFKTTFHQPSSPVSDSTNFVFNKKPLEFDHNDLPSYEYFYNNELKDLVNNIYQMDINQFNYQFKD